jgi:beta-lactamase regulating signal transducer with metallopeptidase domain
MTGLLNAIALGAALSVLSAGLGYAICRTFEQRTKSASTSIWHAARIAAVLPVLIAPLLYFMPEFAPIAAGSDAGFELQDASLSTSPAGQNVPMDAPAFQWPNSVQIGLLLKFGYALGLGLVAIAALRRGLWMKALMHETRSASTEERGIFDQLIRHFDIRPPEFRVTPRSTSPFLTGWMPRIVAPETLFEDPDATRFALAHELTHLRRGDERDRIIGSILVSIFWFNLPLRWIEKALNEAREIACDAESLQALGDTERKPYAAALINMMRSTASPVSAFGSEDRRHREMRIKAILAGTSNRRPSKTLLAITVAAAFIPVACAQTAFTERAIFEDVSMHTVHEGNIHLDGEVHQDHELHEIIVDGELHEIIELESQHLQSGTDGVELNIVREVEWVEDRDVDPDMNVIAFRVQSELEDIEGRVLVERVDGGNFVFVGDVDELEVRNNQVLLRSVDVTTDIDTVGATTVEVEVSGDLAWVSEAEGGAVYEFVVSREGTDEDMTTVYEFVSGEPHPLDPDIERVRPVEPVEQIEQIEPHEPAAPVDGNGEKSERQSHTIAPLFSHPAANGRISSRYGPRPAQPAGSPNFHYGTDIAARSGTPIQAVGEGVVSHAEMGLNGNDGWGNTIVLDHGDGWQTVYAHMEGFDVELGDIVAAGDQIGRIGTTGRSTGPHVHVELRYNGQRIDPANRLPGLD